VADLLRNHVIILTFGSHCTSYLQIGVEKNSCGMNKDEAKVRRCFAVILVP
jgi:hypothetical protein